MGNRYDFCETCPFAFTFTDNRYAAGLHIRDAGFTRVAKERLGVHVTDVDILDQKGRPQEKITVPNAALDQQGSIADAFRECDGPRGFFLRKCGASAVLHARFPREQPRSSE